MWWWPAAAIAITTAASRRRWRPASSTITSAAIAAAAWRLGRSRSRSAEVPRIRIIIREARGEVGASAADVIRRQRASQEPIGGGDVVRGPLRAL